MLSLWLLSLHVLVHLLLVEGRCLELRLELLLLLEVLSEASCDIKRWRRLATNNLISPILIFHLVVLHLLVLDP